MFQRLPVVPVASRWTKIGCCLDFMVGGILCCSVLPLAFSTAFPSSGAAPPTLAFDPDAEIEEWQQQYWHQVTGSRIRRGREFLIDMGSRVKLLVLAIVFEPLRALTTWLLAACREVQDHSKPPRVFDAISASRSIFIVVAQYLSCLFLGSCPRLAFIYRTVGCSSFDEWCEQFPEQVGLLQSAIFAAASWVQRRHVQAFASHPWRLIGVADEREDYASRFLVALNFTSTRPCCLQPGFARRLRQRDLPAEELLSRRWTTAFRTFAQQCRMGIADIEWRHAWNRRHATASTAWHNMSTSYVAREAKYLFRARRQCAGQGLQPRSSAPGVSSVAQPPCGRPMLKVRKQRTVFGRPPPPLPLARHRQPIASQVGLASSSLVCLFFVVMLRT